MSECTIIFVDTSITLEDIAIIAENIREYGSDFAAIDITKQPIWSLKSDAEITGYTISARTDGLGVSGFKNSPLPLIETQVAKGVSPPDKQKIKVRSMEDFRSAYQPPEGL